MILLITLALALAWRRVYEVGCNLIYPSLYLEFDNVPGFIKGHAASDVLHVIF